VAIVYRPHMFPVVRFCLNSAHLFTINKCTVLFTKDATFCAAIRDSLRAAGAFPPMERLWNSWRFVHAMPSPQRTVSSPKASSIKTHKVNSSPIPHHGEAPLIGAVEVGFPATDRISRSQHETETMGIATYSNNILCHIYYCQVLTHKQRGNA